jgi:hypothetical protein
MTIVKPKQLKNNTYKILTIWFKKGGFALDFFSPYEPYEEFIEYFKNECENDGDRLECEQFMEMK